MGLKELRRTELGPHPNEGARLLWEAARARGGTLSDLTHEVGTKPGMLNKWAWCDVRPTGPWAGVLEDLLGIPVRAWHQPPAAPIVTVYRLAVPAAAGAAA